MMLVPLLFVLVSSYVAFADLILECPPNESIAPCSCTGYYSDLGSSIECDIISYSAFQDILRSLKGYKVEYLVINGLNTSMLSTDLFQGLHIEIMRLAGVVADEKSLGHSHFAGLENSLGAIDITFKSEFTDSLSSVKLDHLNSLELVGFTFLGNLEIGNGWFKGPENLDYFMATSGRLERVGDRAFVAQTNLEVLRLSYNHLEEITRSMLPNPANRLQVLNLEGNKIKNLPSDIFSGMPALKEVLLSDNVIQTLPQDTWSPVFYRLRSLYSKAFLRNPLRCDQDLRWACSVNPNEFGETKCASPDDKRGIYVKDFCEA